MKGLGDQASSVAARGLRAMAAGMGAAAAAAAAQEKQYASLAAVILSSFAAGGPIAGAIALLGAGLGIVLSKTKEASKAADEFGKKWEDAAKKARSSADSVSEKLSSLRAERDLSLFTETERRIIRLQSEIASLNQLVTSGYSAALPALIAREDELANLKEIAELEADAADAAKRRAEELKNIKATVEDMSRRTVAGPAKPPWWMSLAGLDFGEDLAHRFGGRVFPGAPVPDAIREPPPGGPVQGPWWPGPIQLPEGFGVPAGMFGTEKPIPPEFIAALEAQWEDVSQSLKFITRDALADGIFDAVVSGGKNLRQILGAAAMDVSRMLLRVGVGAAMQAVGVPMFAGGGIVTQPTLAWVGEGGQAERIEPIHATGDSSEFGPVTVNVHVSGGNPRDVTNAIREAMRSANLRRTLGRGI